jgi:tetratricopeptide (TPR) repeat protein
VSRSKPRRKYAPSDPVVRQPAPAAVAKSQLDLIIWLGLILSVFAVYSQVGHFDFVSFDDIWYVTENARVQAGLTPENIQWALTSTVDANWIPLTILSHMAVCTFFGLESGAHHWVNVVFHALAAVLLFASLQRATRARAPSAFVAFVFALHPLHVESVAWVAERKDVLSTFFWFLALYAYVRYTESPSLRRYLLMVAPFCLGLMSKPMLVTFPFTLLLFDIWPLRRMHSLKQGPKMLWEKLPLIALSAGASAVTYFVQGPARAVVSTPPATRLENALISYVTYIVQMFWPTRLAVFYPYPKSISAWQAAAACAMILGVSALALYTWRTRPYLTTGWFWYLGTLIPVIGLVQVGMQSHADRYMYIPMVGLTVILAWGAADMAQKWPQANFGIAVAGIVCCLACLAITPAQAAYWRNSESLYQRAISVTEDNYPAQFNLGYYLKDLPGRGPEAATHLQEALRINPDSVEAHNAMGDYLIETGHTAEGVAQLQASLSIKPDSVDTRNRVAGYLMAIGRTAEGVAQFEEVLRTRPDNAEAHFNLGVVYSKDPDRTLDAIAHYEAALRAKPLLARAHRNLGQLLLNSGRKSEAIAHFAEAQRIQYDPAIAKILDGLRAGTVLSRDR